MPTPIITAPLVRRAGLLALGLATLLPMLAGSMANMALPALGQAFAVPFASVQWVLVAYLLGITSLTVVAGRLGDQFGRRRLLLGGMALFALASLLCALAPAIGWLIVARVLQGVGAACMLSLALAMVGQLVPPARLGRTMGLFGTLSASGTALGPSFGGLLIDAFGWQVPFLLLVPISLLALGAGMVGLPADRADRAPQPRAAMTGLLLIAALLCYGLALTAGGRQGLGWGVAALFTSLWFLGRERRASCPLLPLTLLAAPRLRNGLLASALVASVMVVTLLIGPFYLPGVFGLDMMTVGLMISGGPLLAALTGLPAGWLVDRFGSYRVIRLGLMVMISAVLGLASLSAEYGPFAYLLPILVLTAGYALFQTGNNSAVVAVASEPTRGAVAGLLTLSRNLGQLTGAAGLGGLFATLVGGRSLGTAMPADLVFGMQASFALTGLLLGAALWLMVCRPPVAV